MVLDYTFVFQCSALGRVVPVSALASLPAKDFADPARSVLFTPLAGLRSSGAASRASVSSGRFPYSRSQRPGQLPDGTDCGHPPGPAWPSNAPVSPDQGRGTPAIP